MKQKIRIGLSCCFFHPDPNRPIFKGKTLLYAEQSLTQWLMREGIFPILLPPPSGKFTNRAIVNSIDALVLQGGSDVCPQTYGEEALKPEWSGDVIRDQYEIALIKETKHQKKPILGICRGIQVLNVAFGGTLYQDIATQKPQSVKHRDPQIYDQNFHDLSIEPQSLLEKIYLDKKKSPKTFQVNSVHHQAIKDLAPGFKVEARAEDDGMIEAIAYQKGNSFIYGVQWHPEFQDPQHPQLLPIAPLLQVFLKKAAK